MPEKAPEIQDEPLIGAEPAEGEGTPPAEPEKKAGKAGREQREADKELERLREENRLLQQSERFWQQKAAGRKDGDDEPEPEPDDLDVSDLVAEDKPDDDAEPEKEQTPDEFIDELSKLGPKAIEKMVAKLGYVRKDDVAKLTKDIARRVVERERVKMTHDAELVSRFPDLRDEQSELFLETQKRFRAAVAKDPKARYSPAALLLAAEAAELAVGGGRRTRRRNDEYDDYRDQREDEHERERRRRVEAQQGDRGRGGRDGDYEADDDLGPEARQIVSAFGVDEKAYRTERSKERKRR